MGFDTEAPASSQSWAAPEASGHGPSTAPPAQPAPPGRRPPGNFIASAKLLFPKEAIFTGSGASGGDTGFLFLGGGHHSSHCSREHSRSCLCFHGCKWEGVTGPAPLGCGDRYHTCPLESPGERTWQEKEDLPKGLSWLMGWEEKWAFSRLVGLHLFPQSHDPVLQDTTALNHGTAVTELVLRDLRPQSRDPFPRELRALRAQTCPTGAHSPKATKATALLVGNAWPKYSSQESFRS